MNTKEFPIVSLSKEIIIDLNAVNKKTALRLSEMFGFQIMYGERTSGNVKNIIPNEFLSQKTETFKFYEDERPTTQYIRLEIQRDFENNDETFEGLKLLAENMNLALSISTGWRGNNA